MGIENLGDAIPHLKMLLRGGAEAQASVAYIAGKYTVVETALRRWFEKDTNKTPEEYRRIKRRPVTIDTAIHAAARRWVKDRSGPELVGRRFFLDLNRRDEPGRQNRRWYRYIGLDGNAVEAIDEETLTVVRCDGGPEIRREIRQLAATAAPYEHARRLRFHGSSGELSTRQGVHGIIRSVLLESDDVREPDLNREAVERRVREAPTLTLLYQSLTLQQREQVAEQISKPPVQMIVYRDGTRTSLLLEPQLKVLEALQAGEDVPSPIHEGL